MKARKKTTLLANAGKVTANPAKVSSLLSVLAAELRMRMSISPVRGLDFESLSRQIDSFNAGHLSQFVFTADALEQRDDVLKCVIPKRKKAAARNGYDILTLDDSAEAKAHQEALKYFYENCRVTNAIDSNERGGIKLLFRQMMDAICKKYAVHEIVWIPGSKGYTAEFRFVPLNFFENTQGRLRFVKNGAGTEGADLEEGGWLVTVGEGVMVACSIVWMFKNLPLKDWAIYSNRHGMPGIKGTTPAQRGSEEWLAMEEAVKQFAAEFAVVMSAGESIESIDTKGAGELPYPALVERCDRALVRLLRGADLGTMSSGKDGVGASLQGEETETLEADDAEMLTEALQQYVDKWVIEYAFGAGVAPKAYIQVACRDKKDLKQELEITKGLVDMGASISVAEEMQRFGRSMPKTGEPVLRAPARAVAPDPNSATVPLENALLFNAAGQDKATLVLIENVRPLLASAVEAELAPLAERVESILRIENEDHALQAVRALRADLPLLLRTINRNPKAELVFYRAFGPALLNGWAAGESLRQLPFPTIDQTT